MNGEVKEGSLEINSDNNPEQFKPGSRAEESVEILDFQIASEFFLVLSFSGDFVCSEKEEGSKGKHDISVIWCRERLECQVKSQIKAHLSHVGAHNREPLMFDLAEKVHLRMLDVK